jgi:hypothetical protein
MIGAGYWVGGVAALFLRCRESVHWDWAILPRSFLACFTGRFRPLQNGLCFLSGLDFQQPTGWEWVNGADATFVRTST